VAEGITEFGTAMGILQIVELEWILVVFSG
jgi:hypothetical protein